MAENYVGLGKMTTCYLLLSTIDTDTDEQITTENATNSAIETVIMEKNKTRLVEPFRLHPLPQNFPYPGQIGHSFLVHGLGHEIAMFLGRGRHFDFGV